MALKRTYLKLVSNFNDNFTGLPHIQGTQGIFKLQKISGKFEDLKNLKKNFVWICNEIK